ncbi:glycosyltransferase family 2 protein [Victivallis vadensis]|uniref:glycosyltransferase family 2 protein n=1 Tax=Victivallis vadensis TaxID=172901 RepID=UPI003AF809EF
MRKKISVTTSCYNEQGNIREWYERVVSVLKRFPQYDYEIVVGDNCSQDDTRKILRQIASEDLNFKVIFNSNNFGAARSGYHAFLRGSGDAVVCMCADLQDPPELIAEFVVQWERGARVVCAVKAVSHEGCWMTWCRRFFYRMLSAVSEQHLIDNFYGFGMYDRCVVEHLRKLNEPAPYFRGLISEIGFRRGELPVEQARPKAGRSSYKFFSYYDVAMTGIVNHSKLPLRLAVYCGFALAGVSLLVALGYFICKLCYWDTFQLGLAPLVIGLFFFSAVQLIFIGIIGEYIGAIWTQVKNKPLVIEEEKINFDE